MSISSSIVRDKTDVNALVSTEWHEKEGKSRAFTTDLRNHPTYRPDIDGLRAVAIIPVVIFHAFPALLPGGFVGVDIFFVISGFLISSVILKGLRGKNFSFFAFYANRVKRIFPALLLVLSFCCLFGWLFLYPGEYSQLGKHILGGAAYAENFVLRGEAGYFDTHAYLKPLMHLWSLGIEEQFYLTYPLLLWLIWRLRCNLLAVIVPLVLISFSLNVWQVRSDAASAFFLPQTRFWELWTGGILAYLDIFKQEIRPHSARSWRGLASYFSKRELTSTRGSTVANILSVSGISLVGAALLLVRASSFPGWWALLPVCGASLLILARPVAWINRRILSNRVAVFIGLISYPLYLWHWPILSFARIVRGGELSRGVSVAAVIASFGLSWATWRFVESPIRFGRKVWTKTAALTLVSVLVGFAGYTIHRQDGFAARFKNLPADFGWSHPETFSTADCRETVGSDKMEYCRSFRTGAPDVLLIGDSHAGSLYRGLAPAYAQRSENLMNIGAPACVPFYDTESYARGMRGERDCKLIINRALDFATSSPSVRTVILSLRGAMDMSGQDFGADANGVPEEIVWSGTPKVSSHAAIFEGAFRNTVSRLSATGKNIVIFIDWPELGFDPRSCLPRPVRLFSHIRPLCGIPRAQVDARNRAYREFIFEMKEEFQGLKLFDPLPYLCDSSACYGMKGGHLLYRDDNHLSAAGADYLSEKFLDEERHSFHPEATDRP